jgi:hypothetical protein
MKRLFVGSLKFVVAAVAVLNTSSVAKAEIEGLQIRFKGGCVEENVTGRCSIAVRASGYDFTTGDRVTLYVSEGRDKPMRRLTNHWRNLNDRGQTIANIRNIPGACFQVRTWTERDDASIRFRDQGRFLNTGRSTRRAYDDFESPSRIDRSQSATVSGASNARVSSNIICEPAEGVAVTAAPTGQSLGGF